MKYIKLSWGTVKLDLGLEDSVRPLKILWTLPYLPWPASNGGRTRQYAILRQMAARGHHITVLCLSKDPPNHEGLEPLRRVLDRLIVIPRRPRNSPTTLLKIVFSLRRPAMAAVNGFNKSYSSTFARLLKEKFDIVQVEHSYGFEPLSSALFGTGTPFFLTEHNVESTIVRLQYMRLPNALRWIYKLDEMRFREWESQVMRRAACVIAVSPEDRIQFENKGAKATALVPNCIETCALSGVRHTPASQSLLFLGNYEYAPNREAVERLCDVILPLVWHTYPGATLAVCGYAMPSGWGRRWLDCRVSFLGYVDDLKEIYSGKSIFVAPLQSGGGSKLKVLEAMAAGLPVVGTAESMSGLAVRNEVHYVAAETDGEIAAAVVRVLSRPKWGTEMGAEARKYVSKYHDWTVAGDALESAYARHLSVYRPTESPVPIKRRLW